MHKAKINIKLALDNSFRTPAIHPVAFDGNRSGCRRQNSIRETICCSLEGQRTPQILRSLLCSLGDTSSSSSSCISRSETHPLLSPTFHALSGKSDSRGIAWIFCLSILLCRHRHLPYWVP